MIMHVSLRRLALLLPALCLLAPAAGATSPLLEELEQSFIRLNEEVRPSVVNIRTRGDMSEEMEDLFHLFGMPDDENHPMPQRRATGSGFIFSEDGYIITNNHVVDEADVIMVRLWDGEEHRAEIVGQDPDTDLAVIKIDSDVELKPVALGDSDDLQVGQFAIALGSPRGFEGSLSFGHISALGRENIEGLQMQGLRFQNLIQTDAAINLGNSGGPLCNIDGEVVGINVAIMSGANSIGFAIPINTAKNVAPQLIQHGGIVRGFLGVSINDADAVGEALGLPDSGGALVENVQPSTPAEKAGLQPYDIIRKVDGKKVGTATGLINVISSYAPGETVTLDIWRNNEAMQVEATLTQWNPEEQKLTPASEPEALGMKVGQITPEVAERLELEGDAKGVLVRSVETGSPADLAGLRPGDVVTEVAMQAIESVEEFRAIVEEQRKEGGSMLVRFIRGNSQPHIVAVKLPAEQPDEE